ncbi:MAG: diguanylate cyclase (GGDEF)-like protein/PAS domain S-box-containing protein [Myxococcota bacterium]|jgi:diguanylate cyclase (GGDEF)-like protein/PAS domain S-box-containing protein
MLDMAVRSLGITFLQVAAEVLGLTALVAVAHPYVGPVAGLVAVGPVALWSWRAGPRAGALATLISVVCLTSLALAFGPIDLTRLMLLAGGSAALLAVSTAVGTAQVQFSRQADTLRDMRVRLAESEFRYRLAAPSASDGLWDWNLDTRTVFYSDRWKDIAGYGPDDLGESATEWFDRIHPEELETVKEAVDQHLAGQTEQLDVEHRLKCQDGGWIWVRVRGCARRDEAGRSDRIVGWMADNNAQKVAEARLRREALHDSLTGLPNRSLFLDRLAQLARGTRRIEDDELFAVLFLDLDRFKHINDSLGHSAGDELLIGVSRRLETLLRAEDTLARMGGDEFTVLLRDLTGTRDAVKVGNRILASLEAPFRVSGQELYVATSIGIALGTPGEANPDEMLRNADAAMYQAKEGGGQRVRIFDESMWARAVSRLNRETELRAALDRGELRLHYQPIVSLGTDRVVGFEALVRWRHPDGRLIPPNEFVPIAEETGLIIQLSQWVIAEAIRQLADWYSREVVEPDVLMSVNLSTRDFTRPELVSEVSDLLEAAGIDADRLVFEITESTAMDEPDRAIETAIRLRHLGVGIALDDFGTGHSSLTYLQRLPVTAIKIDKAFVDHVTERSGELAIVRSVTALARNFGAVAIAEGVETEEQRAMLARLGVHRAQGYLFSAARPACEIEQMLEDSVRLARTA